MEQKCENNTECKTIKYNERYAAEVVRGRLTSVPLIGKQTVLANISHMSCHYTLLICGFTYCFFLHCLQLD